MHPNFKTQILINLLATTYNFEPQKWSHFPATERFPLPWGEGQGEGQTGSSFSGGSSHHPFSPGEKVRMRDRLVPRSWLLNPGNKLENTVQNRQNRRARRFFTDSTTLYQPLMQFKIGVRQFSVGTSLRRRPLCASLRSLRPSPPTSIGVHSCYSSFPSWMRIPRKSSKSADADFSGQRFPENKRNSPEIRVSLEKPLY